MEITQKDRDSLRKAQQKLAPAYVIGNLVEHQIQDPAKYKLLSRQEQGLAPDAIPELPKINYKSVHYSERATCKQVQRDEIHCEAKGGNDITKEDESNHQQIRKNESDLPIAPGDIQSNLWLNMDRIEFDKLEWMSEKAEAAYQEKLRSSTCFDQNGKAIAPGSKAPEDGSQQLHDIGSLVKYLDSTYQPQITYSLNVIAKIAERATVGEYDAVFDENIHQLLIEECLLRARRHLDNPNETTCLSALKCLKSLLCNTQIDEVFLDKMFPLQSEQIDDTQWLNPEQSDFDIEMKDIDCVKVDAILALVDRTDILTRLKYLLRTKIESKIREAYQDCILDILIRIARHSRGVCWVLSHSDFPSLLIENYIPPNILNEGKHMQSMALRSMKLIRIIAHAAYELKQMQMDNSQDAYIKIPESILSRMQAYYLMDCYKSDLRDNDLIFRLHIETLRLMKSLSLLPKFKGFIYDMLALDQSHLVGILKALSQLQSTQKIKCPSSLDWQYAAALIDTMGYLMEHERIATVSSSIRTRWANFMRPTLMQWLSDLIRGSVIPHQDVSIAIAIAVNHFDHCHDAEAIGAVHSILLTNVNRIKDPESNASLVLFKRLVRDAAHRSQLDNFSKCCGKLRDPIMLHSYGFMDFNTSAEVEHRINSSASIDTPFILLHLFTSVLYKQKSKFNHLLEDYFNTDDIARYLHRATAYYKLPKNFETSFQESMLAQVEIRILVESIILLAKYYLEFNDESSAFGDRNNVAIPDVSGRHKQSYSQLIFNTVAIIGLVNPRIEHMSLLKDSLLEKVVLNRHLHTRFSKEGYSRSPSDDTKHLSFNYFNRVDILSEVDNLNLTPVTNHDLVTLKEIYLNCEQPGRYWIFQPLIEYYEDHIKEGSKSKSSKVAADGGKWFVKSIIQNMSVHPIRSNCTDKEIICGILKLNAALMQHSPVYLKTAVAPNLEEYLCLVGLVFLDDELFLEPDINKMLRQNLEQLMHTCRECGKIFSDASRTIATINLTLADIFNKLVEQYEATSYGDEAFSNFLLLFLTTKSDKHFRKILFSEKVQTCLSMVRIGREGVWIPPELLIAEKEKDPEIRSLIKLSGPHLVKMSFLDYYRKYHTS